VLGRKRIFNKRPVQWELEFSPAKPISLPPLPVFHMALFPPVPSPPHKQCSTLSVLRSPRAFSDGNVTSLDRGGGTEVGLGQASDAIWQLYCP
jgi:hypothetical protein